MPFGTVKLNDGNELPVIAFGSGSSMKFHDITQYVKQAIDVGFHHLDTAYNYQTEQYVGLAIKETGVPRSELFITTKCGEGGHILNNIHSSIARLGVNSVNLYLSHVPEYLGDDYAAGWAQFELIKRTGLASSIGVSNFGVEEMQRLLKVANVKPAVNQIKLHPYNYESQKSLLQLCAEHGIVVQAYSSLDPITKYPEGALGKILAKSAAQRKATPTQMIFAWVLSKGAAIVTTSRSEEHLREYLEVADLTPLTPAEVAAIDAAGAAGPPSDQTIMVRIDRIRRTMVARKERLMTAVAIAANVGLCVYWAVKAIKAVNSPTWSWIEYWEKMQANYAVMGVVYVSTLSLWMYSYWTSKTRSLEL
ncbi:Aldo keto reductase [Coniophora puteana RWD-64-598 SS2]|uniref:Aldo keto reductase n=1 Tax=Coniophora puteana (strain RWD-64-598) TaxID=741705 RepID=A0A5M3MQ68_CONPW|nr:Aldo keto reductase [Coniophora puteana RWD-64-598 SS2]EIW81210.1 Aldo keto reductase [Coniophora puteana RWD-64-598 SS2]